ncbi:hypothetical protein PR003_g12018 [Phytophthora rubi]|uniref:Uncharacterized protein n=1 Tax=Phytophthora rubi TaxID=129364 RepID=A0A6A3LY06_9STRA|nr:hypothetical protein PR002_g11472 [Phytophthora rubi]KAE9025963.1 hypothetical protein PR001_g12299 [Phytophthora rubi]KAE9337410.1 hypothetical protein PR003_g12018 [Phytophthora rubi]
MVSSCAMSSIVVVHGSMSVPMLCVAVAHCLVSSGSQSSVRCILVLRSMASLASVSTMISLSLSCMCQPWIVKRSMMRLLFQYAACITGDLGGFRL